MDYTFMIVAAPPPYNPLNITHNEYEVRTRESMRLMSGVVAQSLHNNDAYDLRGIGDFHAN